MKNTVIILLSTTLFILTGCMTSKVNRLHSTTNQLSNDVDSYVELSNKVVDLNNKVIVLKQQKSLTSLMRDSPDLSSDEKNKKEASSEFALTYETLYMNKELALALNKQNAMLSEYFKKLPLILDDKKADIEGLVNNIDIMNQVIEQNIPDKSELKGRLSKNESSAITKTLSSGFSVYQLHYFKKAIDRHYPVIKNALVLQKAFIKYNSIQAVTGKNIDYNIKYENQKNNLVNKHLTALKKTDRAQETFNQDQMKTMEEQIAQPFKLQRVNTTGINKNPKNKVLSKDYIEICMDKKQSSLVSTESYYDLEQQFTDKGDKVVCEFINILGLLKERKFDLVELSTFENSIKEYNDLVDFINKDYKPKQSE